MLVAVLGPQETSHTYQQITSQLETLTTNYGGPEVHT